MRKNETAKNPLLDAIREIQQNTVNKEDVVLKTSLKTSESNLVDIITFCNDPKYLSLPNSNFFLRLSQTIMLKTFYLGTKGNENLKLNKEEWQWLYDHQEGVENDGEKYETNLKDVIKKLQNKEKEGSSNFKELQLVLGRRGGKTILSSIITAYEVYKLLILGNGDPHKYYNLPYDDEIAIINVALSQEQAGRLFGQIQARLRNSPFFEGRIAKETTREIRLFTDADLKKREKATTLNVPGSILILCGHSNPDTLTGYNTILLLFDELAFYDDTGKVTGTYFYNRLKPSLSHFIKYGDARTVEISSPSVRSGVFFERFEASQKYDDILAFQLPTWVTNPEVSYDSPDLIQERERNPEMFASEYGAQWLKGGVYGNYFERELIDRCVQAGIRNGIEPHTKAIPGFTYYLHVDPAKNGNRYVAVLVGKQEYKNHLGKRRSRFVLANIWVWEPIPGFGINFHQTDRDIIQICYKYHPVNITYDQWNSEHSLEALRGCGFNCRQTSFNRGYKQRIYQNLTNLMCYDIDPELWIYEDDRWSSQLIAEMRSLKKRPTMRGLSLTVDKQGESKYDDLIDCLAGACAMGAGANTYKLPLTVSVLTGFR